MKNKSINLIILILSLLSFVICIKLFWNMGIYVDEHNADVELICGGRAGLYMDWIRLFLTGGICILSGVNLLRSK